MFSTTAATEGPDGKLWVMACDEAGKTCDILYRFDLKQQKAVQRFEMGKTFRHMRFIGKDKSILFMVDKERNTFFYKMPKG